MRLFRKTIAILVILTPGLLWGQNSVSPLHEFSLLDLSEFQEPSKNWSIQSSASSLPKKGADLLVKKGNGVLVNRPTDKERSNLITKMLHGDIDLEIEILVPPGSNSGIYFQGRYEVQIFDSWMKRNPNFGDMGGIYQRWDDSRPDGAQGFEGAAPFMNVAKAPGLWQKLRVEFRAPRFDDQGKKLSNALFKSVILNGVEVQSNIEISGPTRAAAFDEEQALAPIMIQGDHGPVAFRNIRYKKYSGKKASLENVEFAFADGVFDDYSILDSPEKTTTGSTFLLKSEVGQDRHEYVAVYSGNLLVPENGDYTFEVDVSWFTGDPHYDGKDIGDVKLSIGGEDAFLIHHGPNSNKHESINLSAGSHSLELRTRKMRRSIKGQVLISLEGPGIERQILNDPNSVGPGNPKPKLILSDRSKAIVQHGFMKYANEKKTHCLAVGSTQGVNFSVDLNNGALMHIWNGDFLDAGPMWQGRGSTQLMIPQGNVTELDYSELLKSKGELNLNYKGFELNDEGEPTLWYDSSIGAISQKFSFPEEGGIRRMIKVESNNEGNITHSIPISTAERISDQFLRIDDGSYYVKSGSGVKTQIMDMTPGLTLTAGSGESFQYDIIW